MQGETFETNYELTRTGMSKYTMISFLGGGGYSGFNYVKNI